MQIIMNTEVYLDMVRVLISERLSMDRWHDFRWQPWPQLMYCAYCLLHSYNFEELEISKKRVLEILSQFLD